MIPQTATLAAVATSPPHHDPGAQARRMHAERARLVFWKRQQIDPPGQRPKRCYGQRDRRPAVATCCHVDAARLPISQNVIAGN